MRLQFKQLWQHERLTKQLQERLFVRPLIEITYSLVEKIKAALARLEHRVISRDVEVDRSTEMTVVAVIHHLLADKNHHALLRAKKILYCWNCLYRILVPLFHLFRSCFLRLCLELRHGTKHIVVFHPYGIYVQGTVDAACPVCHFWTIYYFDNIPQEMEWVNSACRFIALAESWH